MDLFEADHARFERVAPGLLEIRLEPGSDIGVDLISAVMNERMRLCGTKALCVLVLVPADAELDITLMGMDHYVETRMLETLARFYAAYFQPMFRLEAFNRETDAAPTGRAESLAEEEFQVERRLA